MAGAGYTHQVVALDGASANSSTRTSNAILVADDNTISVSIASVAAVASTWSIDGSNDDGFASAIGTWSNVTAITAEGIYSVTPGMRWLRAVRPDTDSQSSVVFAARST
jgi:hypothetical protein